MTREKAIVVLEESKRQNEVMRDNPSTFWASYQMADGVKNSEKRIAALDLALSALRGPTREMVERMFPGCEYCDDPCCPRLDWEYGIDHILPDYSFCPMCGKPLTDEAVDMMLRRWREAVRND